jgi:hypothetical protein
MITARRNSHTTVLAALPAAGPKARSRSESPQQVRKNAYVVAKPTTMRMIMGLDRPDARQVRIAGKSYGDLRWPLREVGALLGAWALARRDA